MAVAKVECTCEYCGKNFIKQKTCYNRKAADDWEEWAVNTFNECPECYGKRMRKEESEKPLTITVKLDVFSPSILFTASGNSYGNKEALKSSGYRWGYVNEGGLLGMFTSGSHMAWQKTISLADKDLESEDFSRLLTEEFDRIDKIGAIREIGYTNVDLAMCGQRLADIKKSKLERQEELSKLTKPSRPEWLPRGRWNENIYGSSKYGYSVYIDGDKITITADQKKELEDWLDARETYDKAVSEIEKKYK